MSPLDMQAWTGVRMIGEATTRAKYAEPARILAALRDESGLRLASAAMAPFSSGSSA